MVPINIVDDVLKNSFNFSKSILNKLRGDESSLYFLSNTAEPIDDPSNAEMDVAIAAPVNPKPQ
jgi:hypothetical protein